jgi:enoyl-CoA hydratase/carnithine racemase
MAVRLEKHDSVGHIVLDRPPANSYDKTFMEELEQSIDEAARDDAVKAILLRSVSEKFFSAGADVSVFARSGLDEQNAFVVCANEAMSKFESTPKVVVAAINGHCLGGGLEMALCCDFRVAAEGSYRIGLPEVSLGLLPGTGGDHLVDEVVPAAELVSRALERLRTYATGPTFAIGRIKKAAVLGFGMPLDEGLKLERQLLIELFKSADAKEGVTAFVEKRKPNYKGN